MTSNQNPKVLDLDSLEFAASEITIIHKGESHHMRTLTVELFIAQQKRAADHEKMVAKGNFSGEETDITDVVSLIRDAVLEFFPTIPVDEMETPKLFKIFAWLNDMSAQINEMNAPEDAGEDEEGNVQTETSAS